MRLVVNDIEATYAVTRPFRLPFHRGGMLHGLFGRALRRVACAEASTCASAPCAGPCARRDGCAWSRLFDPPRIDPPPHRILSGAAEPPGPVVVLSPTPRTQDLKAGDDWRFGLRLFGENRTGDVAQLERALAAVAELPIGAEEGRVELKAMTRIPPREHRIGPSDDIDPTPGRIALRFDTPARLKHKGRLAEPADIDFAALFDHVWRRLTMVAALYGEYTPADDATFRRLREAATAIRTADRRLRVLRWDHLSVESGIRKPLQGLIGHVVFEGPGLPAFRPALAAAEATHIGGGTGLGLGRACVHAS